MPTASQVPLRPGHRRRKRRPQPRRRQRVPPVRAVGGGPVPPAGPAQGVWPCMAGQRAIGHPFPVVRRGNGSASAGPCRRGVPPFPGRKVHRHLFRGAGGTGSPVLDCAAAGGAVPLLFHRVETSAHGPPEHGDLHPLRRGGRDAAFFAGVRLLGHWQLFDRGDGDIPPSAVPPSKPALENDIVSNEI